MTNWYPVGPDFVFAPQDINFKRLSRRNELGRQGLVSNIAIDPTDPNIIYVVVSPSSAGTSAFRTENAGATWTPIVDSLQQIDPTNVNPTCIVVNKDHPEIIYMSTWSGRLYVSNTRGDSWGSQYTVPGNIKKIIVDPRTTSNPSTTVLYAATNTGVFRSSNGGSTWSRVLSGDITSLVAHMPATGTDNFYAGVSYSGVFHTTDPTTTWTNLSNAGIGLPAFSNNNFSFILVDFCIQNPNRVYVWLANYNHTVGLYTTSSSLTNWTQIQAVSPPDPGQWIYSFDMRIAPNSPGDGLNDILIFASTLLFRSIDGGRTWQSPANWFHADQHCFAFFPQNPSVGVIPAFYVGCDGGIAMSSKFADPTFSITTTPTDFNEGINYTDSGLFQNYNHGKQSSAIYQYASDPAISALGYIGCQDTGINAGTGSLGWRGIADADGGFIAATQGADGVKVWSSLGYYGGWGGFYILVWTDKKEFTPANSFATLNIGGSWLSPKSSMIIGLDKKCLCGVQTKDPLTTLSSSITSTGIQTVTPASMVGIFIGSQLFIDADTPNEEQITVTAITATTFTASFTKTHSSGGNIKILHSFVARIGQDAIGASISQDFGSDKQVYIVAASPVDANVLYCATRWDYKLWMTNSGATASSSTVWIEITTNKPALGGNSISSIIIDITGNVFVLLNKPVTVNIGSSVVNTPLFKISGGMWTPQTCINLPLGNTLGFGKIISDPIQTNTLYAGNDARVYQLTQSNSVWTWQDISNGLPGQWIYDLWIGNIATPSQPKVIIRSAIPTRGIWECDVTAGATYPPISLYLRDNLLDQGWLGMSPEGQQNPYDPANPGATLYHYMCADVKIDAQQQGTGNIPDFYQTDPEGILPITNVLFDQLKDNSQNLPGSDMALVHIQVHNRGYTQANNVWVWAIYCNASAGVPGLNESPSMGNAFQFWNQFTVNGQIIPNLPADSPWKSVGPPVILSGIGAAHPKVASWYWRIPLLSSGDPGHYCMVAFIHTTSSPINETSMIVDEITPRNKQVGQKNLHIGPPLPPKPSSGSSGMSLYIKEYVEFHNPTKSVRETTLVFDLRNIPPKIGISFNLTKLNTVKPLSESITGIAKIHKSGKDNFNKPAFDDFHKSIKDKPFAKSQRKLPDFENTTYETLPNALVQVKGVRIPPYGFCAALISIINKENLEEGSEYMFQVQQLIKETIIGGSAYVIRVDGRKKLKSRVPPPDDESESENHAKRFRPVPPWAENIIESREKQMGKRPIDKKLEKDFQNPK